MVHYGFLGAAVGRVSPKSAAADFNLSLITTTPR
jgi:hypothetical protein